LARGSSPNRPFQVSDKMPAIRGHFRGFDEARAVSEDG